MTSKLIEKLERINCFYPWQSQRNINRRTRLWNGFWGFWEDHGARILILFMATLVLLFVIYGISWNSIFVNARDNNNNTWITFISSYWGGILGGVVSGILSIGGTWLVIRFTIKTDYHRQRIENLPIINMEIIHQTRGIKLDFIDVNSWEDNKKEYLYLYICNIGTGIAVNFRHSFEGEEWNDVMYATMFESHKKMLVKKEWVNYEYSEDNMGRKTFDVPFAYEDIFGNEYIQHFTVIRPKDNTYIPYDTYIEAKTPELRKKTKRKQYVQ